MTERDRGLGIQEQSSDSRWVSSSDSRKKKTGGDLGLGEGEFEGEKKGGR